MSGFVDVEGLGKSFSRHAGQRPTTLKQAMLHGWRRQRPSGRFWALRDVSFAVESGSMLAIIGRNGSGKSTLLRLLGGVLRADAGSVHTEGPVRGLLELNSGLHPELSGRENLLIGGVVAGLSIQEVRSRFDEIVAFAELEDFIDQPVRTYSEGMKLRLGFSVAAHAHPGVLLIDEVLAVGDLAFQAKCLDRIRAFQRDGAAIVLATHDMAQAGLCDRALWLDGGRQVLLGASQQVASEFRAEMARRTRQSSASAPARPSSAGIPLQMGTNRFGSLEAEILDLTLLCGADPVGEVETGEALTIEVRYASERPIAPPVLALSIGTSEQDDLLNVDTSADGLALPDGTGTRGVSLHLERLDLAPGEYFVSIGLYRGDWEHALDFHWRAYPLTVTGPSGPKGPMLPPRRWSLA